MLLVVHCFLASSNALKVRFLLHELDLEYAIADVPASNPRPEAYLRINPVGGVPTLDDDGFVLAESNAILRYLVAREGADALYPTGARERARVDQWIDRLTATFRPALFRHESVALGWTFAGSFGSAPRDPERALTIAGEIAPVLRTFDGLVAASGGESGYLTGTFTIADVVAIPALWRTVNSGLDLTPYPALLHLRETVSGRPAFAAAGPVI